MEQGTDGTPRIDDTIEAQRIDYVAQRKQRSTSVARIASTHRHPMALADALESRTEALRLSTLDQDGRIAARDGTYTDAEMLANAWLTLTDEEHTETYSGAFHAAPAEAPVQGCQTRAEWAQCWDDAVEAGSWLTRQWHARQQRSAAVSESRADAVRELMGATSTYVADISDGLHISDITNVARNHKVKTAGQRHRAQYISESEPDVMYGRWRTVDRTESPTVWRNGVVAAGVDGRAVERAAVHAAQRAARLRGKNVARKHTNHVMTADVAALLARVRIGTSER